MRKSQGPSDSRQRTKQAAWKPNSVREPTSKVGAWSGSPISKDLGSRQEGQSCLSHRHLPCPLPHPVLMVPHHVKSFLEARMGMDFSQSSQWLEQLQVQNVNLITSNTGATENVPRSIVVMSLLPAENSMVFILIPNTMATRGCRALA